LGENENGRDNSRPFFFSKRWFIYPQMTPMPAKAGARMETLFAPPRGAVFSFSHYGPQSGTDKAIHHYAGVAGICVICG